MLKDVRNNRHQFLIDATKIVFNSNKKILDKDVDMDTKLDYRDIKIILMKLLESDYQVSQLSGNLYRHTANEYVV